MYAYLCMCQMFKLVLEKAEEPEIKLPTSDGSWKKQESSRKTFLPSCPFYWHIVSYDPLHFFSMGMVLIPVSCTMS